VTSRRFKFAALGLWLAGMAWLVRYEAYPEWFTHVFGGYRSLFHEGQYVVDSWMQIFFQDQVVGYSHTWVDAKPESPEDAYVMRNRTVAVLNLMGDRQLVNVMTLAWLDDQYRLRRFAFAMSSGQYRARIEGRQTAGRTFQVEVTTPADTRTLTVDIPENVVLYSPMTELAVARLRPGQSLRIATLDPVTLLVADAHATAVARERLEVDGRAVEALKVRIDFQGVTMTTWVDGEGRTLRQETPMGWVMEARTSETVDTTRFDAGNSADMLRAFSVPCAGVIRRPREAARLDLRLRLPAGAWEGWHSPRQAVAFEDESAARITLLAQPEPDPARVPAAGRPPAGFEDYLAASPFIQSDHERMIGMARIIVGAQTNAWAAACAIHDWVFTKIGKNSAVSLPSALEVLRVRQGDCNEHTYLFVALARAAGIPARVHAGLVYQRGAFFYHAWPSVHVGEWVEMDPTLGQRTVDATHLTLLTGELQSQLKLGALFGRLSLEVLAEHDDPASATFEETAP
jgi:hypothetical protein